MTRPWTPAERAAIVAAYQAGAGTTALARRYGVSPSRIAHVVTAHGVPLRSRREAARLYVQREDPATPPLATLAARYAGGTPLKTLAQAYAISPRRLRRLLGDAGALRPPAGHLRSDRERLQARGVRDAERWLAGASREVLRDLVAVPTPATDVYAWTVVNRLWGAVYPTPVERGPAWGVAQARLRRARRPGRPAAWTLLWQLAAETGYAPATLWRGLGEEEGGDAWIDES